jgi:hypothetical protein
VAQGGTLGDDGEFGGGEPDVRRSGCCVVRHACLDERLLDAMIPVGDGPAFRP